LVTKDSDTEDLRSLFCDLQSGLLNSLHISKKHIHHPTSLGDETELDWASMLKNYLPKRYTVEKAFVIDSNGLLSEQIDIVIFDRQFSPFIFRKKNTLYVTAESVYAVFEVKQALNKKQIDYCGRKAASVRRLKRTSASIPYAGGRYKAIRPKEILAGILTLDDHWREPFGKSFEQSLSRLAKLQRIHLGCALRTGSFNVVYNNNGKPKIMSSTAEDSLVFFFVNLLYRLQQMGTVPMINIGEYAKWLHSH
jgi:hypothetical protein